MTLTRFVLENVLARATRLRTLVLGDLMLDEYVWGTTERISPEAPVQVVDVSDVELRLGGAGNVAGNLHALGCQVTLAGVIGDDADGEALRKLLRLHAIGTDLIQASPQRATSRKTRVLASNQQMLRIDHESRQELAAADEAALLRKLLPALERADILLLSDYRKGVLTPSLVSSLIAEARQRGVPVVVDPKGSDYRRYRQATLLTPNRKELQQATGSHWQDLNGLSQAAEKLRSQLELQALLVTRSEEGMSLFRPQQPPLHLPAQARDVFDVSGAGDTVLALAALGVATGLDLEDAAALANLAATIVVGKVGTSTVSPQELLDAVGHLHRDTHLKIQSREGLHRILEAERHRSRRIVFTNGCFDLLHAGHVKYLQKARALGDLLVLGLNDDASVRRLKGPKRPLIGQQERAELLAALNCVDYVVLFAEDTPLSLIEAVHPDVLVKGGDYDRETIVGHDLVESYGGRVELIQFVDGQSTTLLIEKILQTYLDEEPRG